MVVLKRINSINLSLLNSNSHYYNSAIELKNEKIYHHCGFYIFTKDALARYVKLKRSKLEIERNLEQMRAIENKINIHVGGAYGNKKAALKRFCKNFLRLQSSAQARLTVENDDKANMYSVKDLYEGVYKVVGIPIVEEVKFVLQRPE